MWQKYASWHWTQQMKLANNYPWEEQSVARKPSRLLTGGENKAPEPSYGVQTQWTTQPPFSANDSRSLILARPFSSITQALVPMTKGPSATWSPLGVAGAHHLAGPAATGAGCLPACRSQQGMGGLSVLS